MKVAVVSDTHVRGVADGLPGAFWELVDSADLLIHLGDFTGADFARSLGARCRMTAVCGNCDPVELGRHFPSVATVRLGVKKAVLMHIGPSRDETLMEKAISWARQGICLCFFGHTHRCEDFAVGDVRFLNPGSAGGPQKGPGGPTAGLLLVEGERFAWRTVRLDERE